jgi:hypothetical protein
MDSEANAECRRQSAAKIMSNESPVFSDEDKDKEKAMGMASGALNGVSKSMGP